jgi:hypothetical protein
MDGTTRASADQAIVSREERIRDQCLDAGSSHGLAFAVHFIWTPGCLRGHWALYFRRTADAGTACAAVANTVQTHHGRLTTGASIRTVLPPAVAEAERPAQRVAHLVRRSVQVRLGTDQVVRPKRWRGLRRIKTDLAYSSSGQPPITLLLTHRKPGAYNVNLPALTPELSMTIAFFGSIRDHRQL